MKKKISIIVMYLVISSLLLLALSGCGSGKNKEPEKESVTINAKMVDNINNELKNKHQMYATFSDQPCEVSILVDSNDFSNNSSIYSIYGRILNPYSEAMLSNCDFSYDGLNGGHIQVGIRLLNNENNNPNDIPQKNDIVTVKGYLREIHTGSYYDKMEATKYNMIVDIEKGIITDHVKAEAVAEAQQKYKDKVAEEAEAEYQKNSKTLILGVSEVDDGFLTDQFTGYTPDGNRYNVYVTNEEIKKIKQFNVVCAQGILDEDSKCLKEVRIKYIKESPETADETTAQTRAIEGNWQNTKPQVDETTLEQIKFIDDNKQKIIDSSSGIVQDIYLTEDHILYFNVSNSWYNLSEGEKLDLAQIFQGLLYDVYSTNPTEMYTMYIKDIQGNNIAGPITPEGNIKLKG